MPCHSEPLLTPSKGHLLVLGALWGTYWPMRWEEREGGREAVFMGWDQPVSLGEEGGQCLGFNRPFLSPLDRAKRDLSARFSNFDFKKAELPNK